MSSQLPFSRIKRIIKEDKEISSCSQEATHLISLATELFIKRLVAQSNDYATYDKRRTIQYKDVARVVSDMEKYDFLTGKHSNTNNRIRYCTAYKESLTGAESTQRTPHGINHSMIGI
jgi:DNA polymerase epsilon subunit 4